MLSHRVRAQTPQIHLHTRGDAHEIQIYFKLCYKREAGAADQPRVRARAERTLCKGVVQEQGYKKWEKALSDKHEAKFTRISDDTDVSLLYHTYFLSFFSCKPFEALLQLQSTCCSEASAQHHYLQQDKNNPSI